MNIFDIEKNYFLLNLNESVGVVNGYVEIGEEIFEQLTNTKPTLIDKGVYLRQLNNYIPNVDCFIGNVSVKYYTCSSESVFLQNEGGFLENSEKEQLNKDLKLINCSFVFYEEANNPLEINKDYFMNVFSHEISHAFRYYSIISQNNGVKKDSIRKADELYGLSRNATTTDKYNDKVFTILKRIVYLSDKNEISAFMNQTYEQIKQNTNINKQNIYNHFNEFRMYRETELLKGLLVIFDNLIATKKGKNACYEFLKCVYADRFTDEKAIKMFRQKIASIINYRIKKFTSIIGKALIDFNRNNDNGMKLERDEMKLEEFLRDFNIIL